MIMLISTAATIAFIHTLMGPDHFLPFVALGRARNWSVRKLTLVTMGCGLGHATGSILLGIGGIWAGSALKELMGIETLRGDFAAWALVAVGFTYMAWGMKQAYKEHKHSHWHSHADGLRHVHPHNHHKDHAHVHKEKTGFWSPWTLFIIFVLGPCEPLIPLMMYPDSFVNVALVVTTFTLVTILTMTGVVLALHKGLDFIPAEKFNRYTHALAGGTIGFCGLGIVAFGL